MGADTDFSLGYNSSGDEFRIVRGANVGTAANAAFSVTPSTNCVIQYGLTVSTGAFYPPQHNPLPTTGYNAGAVITYTGGGSYVLYQATETVVSANSWQKVADQ